MTPVPGAAAAESFWARYGWLLAAVWIVFLLFPILSIAESSLPVPMRVLGYCLLAAFAAVYLWGFFSFSFALGVNVRGHAGARIPFGLMLLIVVASIPVLGPDAISFGPFIISYAAYLLSLRTMWIVNALVLATSLGVAVITNMVGDFIFLIGLLAVLVVVNAVNTALIRHSIRSGDLRMDHAILSSQDRMARDVHDVLGHSLTAVSLKAELAERLLDTDVAAARAELSQIRELTAEALESIRATVGGLRRTTLAEELVPVCAALDDAQLHTVLSGDAQKVHPVRSIVMSWVLRESVTNVLRHAHATTCWITVSGDSLTVEDDGDSLAGSAEGHGLRGLRERARLAEANCRIGTSDHGGTKVSVQWD